MGSILSTKGQIVIPKEVRDAMHWSSGCELEFDISDDSVTIRPATKKGHVSVEEAFGVLAHLARKKPATDTEMQAGVRKMAAESYRRSIEK